jgi:hypothetical protein
MRVLGYTLFAVGVLTASVFAAPEKPFWGPFLLCAAIAAAGALLIRYVMPMRGTEDKARSFSLSAGEILTMIADIGTGIDALLQGMDGRTTAELKGLIEESQKEVNAFVESRDFLQERAGVRIASEVFSSFSRGERYLARAWSALVDGYLEEMRECLITSGKEFSRTDELLRGIFDER